MTTPLRPPETEIMTAEQKTPLINTKGRKAIARGFAFLLFVVGCGQLFTFVVPGFMRLYAINAWPVQTGTMSDSVQQSYSYPNEGTSHYEVRDLFRIREGAAERVCHWDEPVTTDNQYYVDERLKPGAWLWPRGATVALHVQPGGQMCEPVEGWSRALALTTFWLRLWVACSFGAAIVLWFWQRRIRVPADSAAGADQVSPQ
jgi:hypothetical protein